MRLLLWPEGKLARIVNFLGSCELTQLSFQWPVLESNIESTFINKIIADLAKQVLECACAVVNSTDMPLLFSSCQFVRICEVPDKGVRISEGLLY